MTYRILNVEEWALVEPEFAARNVPMPDPRFAMIAAAFHGDDPASTILAGFWVLQLQLHAEPLVLFDPHCFKGLFACIKEEIKTRLGHVEFYCFAEGKVAKMAELSGLQRVNMDIFKGSVE